jgi:hypothetical protein
MANAFVASAANVGHRLREAAKQWRDRLSKLFGRLADLFRKKYESAVESLDTGGIANPRSKGDATQDIESRQGKPHSKKPIIVELQWRAACELLQWLGGARIPRHLRAHFEKANDPTKAVALLVADLKCDLDRLCRGDRDEQDLFLDRLETLVELDVGLADTDLLKHIAQMFEAGEFERLRELSNLARRLRSARERCGDAAARAFPERLACLGQLLRAIDESFAKLETLTLPDVVDLGDRACDAYDAADRIAAASVWRVEARERIRAAAPDWWNDRHAKHAEIRQLEDAYAAALGALLAFERLSPATRDAVGRLDLAVGGLRALAAEAEAHSDGSSGSRGWSRPEAESIGGASVGGAEAGGRRVHGHVRDECLAVLGFSPGATPTPAEVNSAYRGAAKVSHPGSGWKDDDRMTQVNACRARLLDRRDRG